MPSADRNTRNETADVLRLWDAAVAVNKARRRALSDSSITTDEYCALSAASSVANINAVVALGGYSKYTCPDGVGLGGNR